jgi:large subunit ribosomal protein L10
MLTKEEKREQSDQLRAVLSDVNTLFLMENTGLDVNEINELRSQIRKTEATYKVYKNTVVKLAVDGTDMEDLTPDLVGPKALAYTTGDGVALAKVLKEFIKEHPELSFHRGYLDGQVLDAGAAREVAELPSKDELIAKLLNLLQSPIRRLAVALNWPTQGLATALEQIAQQKESEGGSE